MVEYSGDIRKEAVFDPAKLSGVFGQVKFKAESDVAAEQAIRLIGLPRDPSEPLPYLTLLLELGSEANHRETGSKIKVTTPTSTVTFQKLREEWLDAIKALESYKSAGKKDKGLDDRQKKVVEKRLAMDAYN